RNRRLSGASWVWRGVRSMGDTPRRALVRRSAGVSTRALGQRFGQAASAIRVLSVWRRPAPMHWEHICVDGSERGAGYDWAEVPVSTGSKSQGYAAGFD